MVGVVGWLDARKEHWRSAHIAVWRQIIRLQRIIEMRLRHDEAPLERCRRKHRLVSQPPTPDAGPLSMMLAFDVRSAA
jgi:hypothetical protein